MTWISDGVNISRHCQLSSIDLLKEETKIEFVFLRTALDKVGGRMFLQNTCQITRCLSQEDYIMNT